MADDTPEAAVEFTSPFGEEAERAERAKRNKEAFEGLTRGALARAQMLPREHLESLGFAAADLMLMQIVTGRLKPKTAKEAIDVAKAALEIARRESGEADTTIVIRTPEQRQTAIDRIRELQAVALERGGFPAPAPKEPDAIDVGSEIIDPDIVAATSVPHAATIGAALRTVPTTSNGSD